MVNPFHSFALLIAKQHTKKMTHKELIEMRNRLEAKIAEGEEIQAEARQYIIDTRARIDENDILIGEVRADLARVNAEIDRIKTIVPELIEEAEVEVEEESDELLQQYRKMNPGLKIGRI